MSDIVIKYIELMKPYINDLAKREEELANKEELLNLLCRFFDYTNNDYLKILSFDNEDFIKEFINNNNYDYDKYKAYKYILESDIETLKYMPQYVEANNYLESIYNDLLKNKEMISNQYNELDNSYHKCSLINKYYNMFINKEFVINDLDEIKELFSYFDLSLEEKNEILKNILLIYKDQYIDNTEEYNSELIDEIKDVINNNSSLLTGKYSELMNAIKDFVNIENKLKNIVSEELLNKINIKNIILAKKVYLIRTMNISYKANNYNKLCNLYNEYNNVLEIMDKINNNNDKYQIIKIVKGEC